MSRIAKKPMMLPAGVDASVSGNSITVKGKHGELTQELTGGITVTVAEDGNSLTVDRTDLEEVTQKALQGTFYRLISNMVVGVSEQFTKRLLIEGVGYRAALKGKQIEFQIGFCHPVIYDLAEGVTAELPSNTEIILKGCDKQVLGQDAANIRAIRKPEPYKGKGIRYSDEIIRRKAGKAFAK
jgi:large subunit ribosomal protein L6